MGIPPPGSQAAPLPKGLPFRIVSKTIGSGAYACIRKACPTNAPLPIIAIKFINNEHAKKVGRLSKKQISLEIALHRQVSGPNQPFYHPNVIRILCDGEDAAWTWIALELADGGDLFDKIEADEGVGEDVAHFYFTQLVSAVGWCHSKSVAHRDIKPENMLLSAEGNLKLADFGLATMFNDPRTGQRKLCGMVCGSPPYIAPEIVLVGHANQKRKSGQEKQGYEANVADLWSCAIVLFVLLVGNTPWDLAVTTESYEFHEFVETNGRSTDQLWQRIPSPALSLLRGMLKVVPQERFSLDETRRHPWYTQRNPLLNDQGTAANPVGLATRMLESLRIDLSAPVPSSQRTPQKPNTERPSGGYSQSQITSWTSRFASTQPDTPTVDTVFDWEKPPLLAAANANTSASQPTTALDRLHLDLSNKLSFEVRQRLAEDPSMSQFSATPTVPLSLTQMARKFNDVVPSHSLARFYSPLSFSALLPRLVEALHHLNVPAAPLAASALEGRDDVVCIRFKTVDGRQQPLHGNIVVERAEVGNEMLEVRFVKAKGDPLEWRRVFKKIVVLCKDGILLPGS
ncbi:Chk1 protein kinase [Elasticomyces elasticus]|nr:Chk1 protein kinase [Elasticomyces elasticus]